MIISNYNIHFLNNLVRIHGLYRVNVTPCVYSIIIHFLKHFFLRKFWGSGYANGGEEKSKFRLRRSVHYPGQNRQDRGQPMALARLCCIYIINIDCITQVTTWSTKSNFKFPRREWPPPAPATTTPLEELD